MERLEIVKKIIWLKQRWKQMRGGENNLEKLKCINLF